MDEFLKLLAQGGVNLVTIVGGGALLLREIKRLYEVALTTQDEQSKAVGAIQDKRINALELEMQKCAEDRMALHHEMENHRERAHERIEELWKIIATQHRAMPKTARAKNPPPIKPK